MCNEVQSHFFCSKPYSVVNCSYSSYLSWLSNCVRFTHVFISNKFSFSTDERDVFHRIPRGTTLCNAMRSSAGRGSHAEPSYAEFGFFKALIFDPISAWRLRAFAIETKSISVRLSVQCSRVTVDLDLDFQILESASFVVWDKMWPLSR